MPVSVHAYLVESEIPVTQVQDNLKKTLESETTESTALNNISQVLY